MLTEDGVLVVLGLEAHGPQDGLAQPLQPEDKQQRPHDSPEHVYGDEVDQCRPQCAYQHDEYREGAGGALQGGPPTP